MLQGGNQRVLERRHVAITSCRRCWFHVHATFLLIIGGPPLHDHQPNAQAIVARSIRRRLQRGYHVAAWHERQGLQ